MDGSGNVTHTFLNGPGANQVLADDAGAGNVTWLLSDNQGSVRDVINGSGVVLDHIQYDSYGNIIAQSSPANQPRFGYAGAQLDAAMGLYYDNARFYDPLLGRFISQDPAGFRGGNTNLYGYVNNSLVNFTDPTGRSPKGSNGTGGFWSGFGAGAGKSALAVAGIVLAVAIVPEMAVPLLLWGAAFGEADIINRMNAGQSGGDATIEALADLTGVNGISEGLTGNDVLGNNVNLTDYQRGEAFGSGLVQAGTLAYGGVNVLAGATGTDAGQMPQRC